MKSIQSFEVAWKEYVRLRKRSIELMGCMAAYIADNRNAKLSLRAQQALAEFSPASIKGRVLDLLTETDDTFTAEDVTKALNAQHGHGVLLLENVRFCLAELAKESYVLRVKHGVYRAIEDDDVEGVKF